MRKNRTWKTIASAIRTAVSTKVALVAAILAGVLVVHVAARIFWVQFAFNNPAEDYDGPYTYLYTDPKNFWDYDPESYSDIILSHLCGLLSLLVVISVANAAVIVVRFFKD
jgi:hypothetical protein